MTLTKALDGFIELLREAHTEDDQRTLSKLIERLSAQGFDTGVFTRRSA